MSKRIITLGTWEGKPIEWIVAEGGEFWDFSVQQTCSVFIEA